ncbi:MAG: hypothetical protein O2923_07905 [Verrucomicrobia bacterium]|nr:hypothetical protein [Verrucomicrobiota bacterium]MDA1086258.1 hypothetical protein [Verrucomicrobiota bacterium]
MTLLRPRALLPVGFASGIALAIVWLTPAAAMAAFSLPDEFDAGFLASRDTGIDGSERLRIAGPIFEASHPDSRTDFVALRPLFSRKVLDEDDPDFLDVLWPLYTRREYRDDMQWRCLTLVSHDFDTSDPASRYRFWGLPIFFKGRDVHGEKYLGLFPIGGSIHEIIGQDEIRFVMFPAYARSRFKERETTSVMWPIFSHTQSPTEERWRVFPFYGQSTDSRAGENRRFVLWPIWTSIEYDDPPGRGFALFPLFGRVERADQSTWMVLPPFFRHSRRGDDVEALLPWPFVKIRRGAVRETTIWPLWGHKDTEGVERIFAAWPLGWHERIRRDTGSLTRTMLVPFYYYERDQSQSPETRYWKIWPLLSYQRSGHASRIRMLELWPLRDTPPIERNYSPLWTLLRYERLEDARETEFLWGFYRHRRDVGGHRKMSLFPFVDWERREDPSPKCSWSILKGLIGYGRTDEERMFRLLYFLRFGVGEGGAP